MRQALIIHTFTKKANLKRERILLNKFKQLQRDNIFIKILFRLIIIILAIIIFITPDLDSFTLEQSKNSLVKTFNENEDSFLNTSAYLNQLDGDVMIILEKDSKLRAECFTKEGSYDLTIDKNQVADIKYILKRLGIEYISKINNHVYFERISNVGFPKTLVLHKLIYIDDGFSYDNTEYSKISEHWYYSYENLE